MPYINGEYSRSAGQGYARAKAQQGETRDDAPAKVEHEGDSKGSVLHVKHHGGGKFSTKDESGNMMKHESIDALHSHMAQHFGVHEGSQPGEEDSEYEGDGGEALKSILG